MIDREEQIRRLFPLVRTIARRTARLLGTSDLDDLIGDGSVGLIRAVDSFDPTRGPSLEQYARRVIAGAMLNGIRRMDFVSERVRRTIRYAERERFALASQRGSLPSQREMEDRHRALAQARAFVYRAVPLSMDTPLPGDERLDVDPSLNPQLLVETRAARTAMYGALEGLPQRERHVITQHYFADWSLRQLSADLAISPQRVSQLHLLGITRLRGALAATR